MQRERILTYRLRGNRITAHQEAAFNAYWEKFGLPDHGEINLKALIPEAKSRILEIGFGMGEATAKIAKAMPDVSFLAVEVHKPGVGKLMSQLVENGSENVRIIHGDVYEVITKQLRDQTLDGVHIFFPDPWQKKRHYKRRLITSEFLDLLYPKIKPGGFIHIATDWAQYAEWINNEFEKNAKFSGGEVTRPDWRPVTRFEGQGIDKNHRVTDFRYVRN